LHAEVHAGLACLRLGLAAAVWLAGPGSVAARTPADVQSVVTVATAAVREAFGGEADVILSQPVLSLTTEAVIVMKAVPEPASRTAGPVRFVLYASVDGTERRVGRLTARVDVAATG